MVEDIFGRLANGAAPFGKFCVAAEKPAKACLGFFHAASDRLALLFDKPTRGVAVRIGNRKRATGRNTDDAGAAAFRERAGYLDARIIRPIQIDMNHQTSKRHQAPPKELETNSN